MECELVVVDLGVPSCGILDAFVNLAQSQREKFVDIFPWHIAKDRNIIMIIAATNLRQLRESCRSGGVSKVPTESTQICGWLTAIVSEDRSVYLAEISSRGAVDGKPTYKGIGRLLFSELISWSQSNTMSYIYLFPLNERVECIYKRWGLQKLEYSESGSMKTTRKMFYIWDVRPDNTKIKSIQNSIKLTDMDIIAHALTDKQMKFMAELAEKKKNDQNAADLYDKISESIQGLIAICDEMELSEKVTEYFQDAVAKSLLKKSGGRKSR